MYTVEMQQDRLIQLIDNYLSGKCTAEECRLVEEWYASYEQTNRDFYDGDKYKRQLSTARSLSALIVRLRLAERPAKAPIVRKPRHVRKWLVAACILILFSTGTVLYYNSRPKAEVYTVVQTGIGDIKQLRLPDGTLVWLNAGSTIRYSSAYNSRERQVQLSGEAYFDVVRKKNKPFTIRAGKLDIHVLGTAFSISAYPGAVLNTVAVCEGKVQVENGSRLLGALTVDRKLEYHNGSGKGIITEIDATSEAAWKEQQLAFTDLPMFDITLHLQRWYGYRFYFKNEELKQVRFTASFKNTISLASLLKVMREVSHVRYQLDHQAKTVTFL